MRLSEKLRLLCEWRFALPVVLLLCLALRFALAFYKGDVEVTDNDARVWMQIADNLLAGNGFALGRNSLEVASTAYSEPGYPAFLALIFATVGDDLRTISLVQSALDTLTCLLVFWFAVYVSGGSRVVGVLSSLAYAGYPPFIISACTPMTETFQTFVFTIAVWSLTAALRGRAGHAALAGAMMGLAILVRSPMTLLPILAPAAFALSREKSRAWVTRSVLYVAAAYLVFSPWVIRNYLVFDAFIPIPTRSGQALWGGTGPADGVTLGSWSYPVDSVERNIYDHPRVPDISEKTFQRIRRLQAKAGALDELRRDRYLRGEALSEVRRHPGRFAFLAVKKVFRLWFNLWYDWPPSAQSLAFAALNVILFALAVMGCRTQGLSREFRIVLLMTVAYVTVTSSVTYAMVRYSYPALPLVIIAAAAYLASLCGESGFLKRTVASTDRVAQTSQGIPRN